MSDLAAIRDHWNERARLGPTAGSQDVIAAELERRALLAELKPFELAHQGACFLEIGCGIGDTARLVRQSCWTASVVAVDNAEAMIREARQRTEPVERGRLSFLEADVTDLPAGQFDLAYTQRMLINLPTWELQHQALRDIADRLVPGGRFLMVENSLDGLAAINADRLAIGLPVIQAPWHNRYFSDRELATVTCLKLVRCVPFSSTYYFLSRVVNAWQAQHEGRAPAYDAPINALALLLPSSGPWAQNRLWVWSKE